MALPSSSSAATVAIQGASASKGATDEGGGGGGAAASTTAMKKGPWTAAEDAILIDYVREHGEGNWNAVQKNTGLSRCGKSCRLRWANHLRPNLKKGSFSPEEERLILELHSKMGNKWARMAAQLPGRTDNEIKNYWNTRIKRRQRAGLPLYPSDIQRQTSLHHRPLSSASTPPSFFDPRGAQFSAPVSATPLSLFDPINLSGTAAAAGVGTTSAVTNTLLVCHPQPFLAAPAAAASHPQRVKRLRDDAMSFSMAFDTHPVPPAPSQSSFFPFNPLGNYDLGPPPSPFPLQQQQGFSVKMELPSSQLYPGPSTASAGGGGAEGLPLERSDSELLDALLRGTEPLGSSSSGRNGNGADHYQREFLVPEPVPQDLKWVKTSRASAHPAGGEPSRGLVLGPAGKWDDSNHPVEIKTERAQAPAVSPVEDDLSALLDAIPMAAAAAQAAAPRDWHTSDSGEVSNGQSSAVTDEIGLQEMQQLASSLSMAAEEDRGWSMGPCHWDDTPGIR